MIERLVQYWFEIDNVLRHMRSAGSPTGIQRVSLEIFSACAAIDKKNCRPMRMLPFGTGFEIANSRVFDDASQPLEWLKRLARNNFSRHEFQKMSRANDWIIATGASWSSPRFLESVRDAKARGLRLALFVHDIIPIVQPYFFEAGHSAFFTNWHKSVLELADCVFVSSRHVEAELAAYMQKHGWIGPRPTRIRFGDGFTTARAQRSQTEPFVLFVSSVDIRKNHDLLIRIWTRLYGKYGEKVWRLVFIGRRSYGSGKILAALKACGYLGGRIEWRENVSDATIAQAYTDCAFTIYPSFCEGWGLPVAESLSYGRPCLAANTTSLPEVGGCFADYFDPADEDGAFALIERALFEPGWLASREDALKNYVPAKWDACARMIIKALEAHDAHMDGTFS